MLKRALFVFVMTLILLNTPWRLLALVGETFVVSPGSTQVSASNDGYWKALDLDARLDSLAWGVFYKPNLVMDGAVLFGVTIPTQHAIFIDADLHWSARYAVLAHEAGHTLQPGWMNREQGEAFAESVAMLVAGDGYREHARYLVPHKWTLLGMVLTEWPAIYHAAAVLEDR